MLAVRLKFSLSLARSFPFLYLYILFTIYRCVLSVSLWLSGRSLASCTPDPVQPKCGIAASDPSMTRLPNGNTKGGIAVVIGPDQRAL